MPPPHENSVQVLGAALGDGLSGGPGVYAPAIAGRPGSASCDGPPLSRSRQSFPARHAVPGTQPLMSSTPEVVSRTIKRHARWSPDKSHIAECLNYTHHMTMKSFVVTGASSGIGRACVDELVRTGARVWATVRSSEDEEALSRIYPSTVSVLTMDLTDPESILAAGRRVCSAGPLDGLVNNAGVALPAPLEHVPLDRFRYQMEVNLVGQLAVTQAMLPALREAAGFGSPRIVLVGSIGGRIAGPMLGAYHASKFGLVGLSDSLRAELAPIGIRVTLIEPGVVATAIWERGSKAGEEVLAQLSATALDQYSGQIAVARNDAARAARRGIPAQRAASVIVKALTSRNPRPRYLVGTDARIAAQIAQLPARVRYRFTAAKL